MEKTKQKLNYKNTLFIGFGFLASSLAWSLYNSFVPLILEEKFLLSTTLIGTVMTIDNFFGLIFQPTIGILSDKTNTKLGKRMPWILFGLPISAILFAFIPKMSTLLATMAVLVVFNFMMSLWRSPVIALMPDVTPRELRSSANGIINLMGGIGSIIAFFVGGKLAQMSGGLGLPFFMGSCMMGLSLILLLVFVREPAMLRYRERHQISLTSWEQELLVQYNRDVPEEEGAEEKEEKLFGKKIHGFSSLSGGEKRSLMFLLLAIFGWFCGYNAVETFFTLFATNNLGVDKGMASMMLTSFSLTFLVFAVPSGLIAQKIGRKKMIMIGLAGLVATFLPILFVENVKVVLGLLFVGGIFWACININSLPMVVELASNESIGSFTGYYYFFSFSAAIVSPILFGFIRDMTNNYSSLFIYSVVAFALSLGCMLFVKHGDYREEKVSK